MTRVAAGGVRVGLLDSGAGPAAGARLAARRDFITPPDAGAAGDSHGENMAEIILALAPSALLLDARVFAGGQPARPATVAAGLDWLVQAGAELVNLSLGLREDRTVLRDACARAAAAGIVLVAAAPARGARVFPAAYTGVLPVTGDARCAPREYAWLGLPHALFGACVGDMVHRPHAPGGGASCAAAHVTGALADLRGRGVAAAGLVAALRAACRHRGRERHQD